MLWRVNSAAAAEIYNVRLGFEPLHCSKEVQQRYLVRQHVRSLILVGVTGEFVCAR